MMKINNKFIILVKAPKENELNDKYVDVLEDNNYKVRILKSLDFKYNSLDVLYKKLSHPENYSGLIFTSPRCVEAVKRALQNKLLNEQWKTKNNYVVGESTRDIAKSSLDLICKGHDTGNAENLSDFILKDFTKSDKTFLVPHGNLKTDTLSVSLQKGGIKLDELTVYESIKNPNTYEDFIKLTDNLNQLPKFMVFFSPSAVSCCEKIFNFAGIQDIKFFSIGPSTQKELEHNNQIVSGTCAKPTVEELLKLIESSS